ncbi:hypothetical protein GJ496_003547 [Pomphorhynchus laevis]|nr:hypothetical protein GJ496_003547 [Pomphorhynchus laevis]
MTSIFRSQEMNLCQIIMPSDSAFKCVAELGELENVHFNDLNTTKNAFDKKFINEIRSCDEIERKLRYVEKELQKYGISPVKSNVEPAPLKSEDMHLMEVTVERMYEELNEVMESTSSLIKSQCELNEFKHVLNTVHSHFNQDRSNITELNDVYNTVDVYCGDNAPLLIEFPAVECVVRNQTTAVTNALR